MDLTIPQLIGRGTSYIADILAGIPTSSSISRDQTFADAINVSAHQNHPGRRTRRRTEGGMQDYDNKQSGVSWFYKLDIIILTWM